MLSFSDIAFIGNMNNNNSVLMRYLADEGLPTDLLLFSDEAPHFSPYSDGCSTKNKNCNVIQLSWGSRDNWYGENIHAICSDLAPYKKLIGTDKAPAYCHRARRKLEVFIPHGSDLFLMPHFYLTWPSSQLQALHISLFMRAGILESSLVHICDPQAFQHAIANLEISSHRLIDCSLPLIYHKSLDLGCKDTPIHQRFLQIRDECDIMLVSNIRHVWGHRYRNNLNNKGNDALIHAVSRITKLFPALRLKVLFFEYGLSVSKSKRLISELGLRHVFEWFPCVPRADLLLALDVCDVVCGELVYDWLLGSTICEALVTSKPYLGKRNDSKYSKYNELYFMLNAFNRDPVDVLADYIYNKHAYDQQAANGLNWYVANCVTPAVTQYLKLLS
jgi:hypothetical protein